MFKVISIFSILLFSTLSFSQRGPRRNSVKSLLNKTSKLEQALLNQGQQMSALEKSQVSSILKKAIKLVKGMGGGDHPGGDDPYNQAALYEAKCHVDDDSHFDFDQAYAGVITGSISQILSECKQRALATYGTFSSSGINQLKLINAPHSLMIAICHIDDDSHFDFDQIIMGKIAGQGTADIKSQCDSIAKSIYGSFSSSGLKFL